MNPNESNPERYVAPRNEMEERLARWWQEFLGIPRIGIKDNFFELGGRPLIAAQLFARIDQELSRALPIATLLKYPTVEELAAFLAEGESLEAFQLFAVQPEGPLPPFFCIPGVGSDALTLRTFARALGPDQPFYGLQARGLDATPLDGELPEVEDIASGFIAEIRRVQPEGPYFLGGHCFGSLLAWEVARQMTAQGLEVGRLVLLDPIVSNIFSDNTLGWDRLRYHWHKLRRTSLRSLSGFVLDKLRNYGRAVIARQRVGRSWEMAERIHSRYRLASFDGRVLIFMAEDSSFAFTAERDPRRYYEKLAEGGVDYLFVPGNHHSILHGQEVIQLAALLRTCLAEARDGESR